MVRRFAAALFLLSDLPGPMTAAELAAKARADHESAGRLVHDAKIKVEN